MDNSVRTNFEGLYADLTERVIGSAMKVHRTLGPGFIESVYEEALTIQLAANGIQFERQKELKVVYEGQVVGTHRLDLLVDDKVIVELKAKEHIVESDQATTLSYLKATNKRLALILNFGRPSLEIKRLGNTNYKK